MKKLMNKPSGFVDEMLDGLVAANPSLALGGDTGRVVHRAKPIRSGKVGVRGHVASCRGSGTALVNAPTLFAKSFNS